MSITFDTERWSSRWRARDLETQPTRSSYPRVVSLADLNFFKSKPDIYGDAFFRSFEKDDDDERARIARKQAAGVVDASARTKP
jgi:hypothetical protein